VGGGPYRMSVRAPDGRHAELDAVRPGRELVVTLDE
jgi:hypothetical protein